jgi:cAMP-dependent protein kinase regulator
LPNGLTELLQQFTVSLLRKYPNYPNNLVDYAVEYFTDLQRKEVQRQVDNLSAATSPRPPTKSESAANKEPTTSGSGMAGVRFDDVESDSEDLAALPAIQNRRHSVAAESFDPEKMSDDEDSEERNMINPKTDEQRRRLEIAVKDILLFRCLDPLQKSDVINAMKEVQITPGAHVIDQGAEGDNFYVIESGTYDIYVAKPGNEPTRIGQYQDKGSFGELALMYNTPRAATIVAATSGVIWSMDRATFRRIVLKQAFKKRQLYESFLENVSLLKELSAYERTNLADALQTRLVDTDDLIIAQGDTNCQEMYFIEEGEVKIIVRSSDNSTEREVNRLRKGDYFGELALITHKPRLASAYAVCPTKLAVLDVDSFERLMGPCLDIMKRNKDVYLEQLREAMGSDAFQDEDLRGTQQRPGRT